jgi:selT/selW/selH-like putative selenoprotein
VAAEIREALRVEAELIEGSGGVFEVEVDGEIIFDKALTDRFPNLGEVSSLLGDQ